MLALLKRLLNSSLVLQIFVGMLVGAMLAWLWPSSVPVISVLGTLFIGALKAVAPILVFVLVMSAIAGHTANTQTHIRPILLMYLVGTLGAALIAVAASFLFPSELILQNAAIDHRAPKDIAQVLANLLNSLVANPVTALVEANFIGLLAWAVGLGLALRPAGETTHKVLGDFSRAITQVILWVIRCAPLGVMGLVAVAIEQAGGQAIKSYLHVLLVLIGCMVFVALVLNPILVYSQIRRNPFPLVWLCLRESGVTAFFTRSSAANVPVNLALAKRLGLHENTYSVSIPLGATINMAGAAVTISVLTLAATHTLGIPVDIWTALLLCVVASVCACGVSGVAGGSLLLIPLACDLFGIPLEQAMQVVAIGFTISVIQDSVETALNSSTDILLTAAVCLARQEHAEADH